jgi:hypothetical protein
MLKNNKIAKTKLKFLKKKKHFICPLFHLIQMNLQILLTPLQNLNLFELTLLNWKAIYIHLSITWPIFAHKNQIC